jgi:hypothetical protein
VATAEGFACASGAGEDEAPQATMSDDAPRRATTRRDGKDMGDNCNA